MEAHRTPRHWFYENRDSPSTLIAGRPVPSTAKKGDNMSEDSKKFIVFSGRREGPIRIGLVPDPLWELMDVGERCHSYISQNGREMFQ